MMVDGQLSGRATRVAAPDVVGSVGATIVDDEDLLDRSDDLGRETLKHTDKRVSALYAITKISMRLLLIASCSNHAA